jgi:flagellin-like protein
MWISDSYELNKQSEDFLKDQGEDKLTKKMVKSKKAISPILATLLLIVIAVAAIVVTYAWVMTYMSSAGQQAGVRLYKENIRFYGASNDLTDITIGNSGTENTRIVRVWMGNTSTNMVQVYSDETGRLLEAGSAVTITITWPNILADSWQPGKNYYFTIVPSPGSPLEKFPEQAPQ